MLLWSNVQKAAAELATATGSDYKLPISAPYLREWDGDDDGFLTYSLDEASLTGTGIKPLEVGANTVETALREHAQELETSG